MQHGLQKLISKISLVLTCHVPILRISEIISFKWWLFAFTELNLHYETFVHNVFFSTSRGSKVNDNAYFVTVLQISYLQI